MSSLSCKQNFPLIPSALKFYHHSTSHTATSLAWSSPLSPELICWQPFDSSPTSTLVPSSLFSTQQLLSSWKCVLDHLTLLLKPFNDFLTLGFYFKAYKAQQRTGPVTPLASSPTTPALTAFFLFLKHAKVKHAKLIPPQGLCTSVLCLECSSPT